jgi:hypothetical protein
MWDFVTYQKGINVSEESVASIFSAKAQTAREMLVRMHTYETALSTTTGSYWFTTFFPYLLSLSALESTPTKQPF